MEHDIMHSLALTGGSCGCELRKILDEVSPKNINNINKLLNAKDEEIVKLRDEIRIMSAHWKLKTKDLESQLEKASESGSGVEEEKGIKVGILPPGSSFSNSQASKDGRATR